MVRAGMYALAIVASWTASCADPSLVDCGDGRICPAGSVCTPRGCSLLGGCGDAVLDEGEECDDGGRTGGDGCSPTCMVEACPNTMLDPGEECDDGNALSHDGCSSGCLVERPTWRELTPASSPAPREGMAAAWLPDRGRAILHGGRVATIPVADVWWWDGSTWEPAPAGPPARAGHAMAWDGADTVVMVGGGEATPSNACWRFGTSWTPCSGPLPPARRTPGLATAATPGEVVLFGGDGLGDLRSTWRGSAAGWSDLGQVGPSSVGRPAMAYDPRTREQILVHLGPIPPQTWTRGEMGWTSHDDGWVLRDQASLVHDPDRGTMVAFGGMDELVGPHNEAFERGPGGWTELVVGARPAPRGAHIGFHDAIRRGVVVFGGFDSVVMRSDTWLLRWESATLDEACDVTMDVDLDGLAGCADPDCWGRCDPRCPPSVAGCDPARPRCGDGVCNASLETPALCPEDCP